MKILYLSLIALAWTCFTNAQEKNNLTKTNFTTNSLLKRKHAQPIYIDLMHDLRTRKEEVEFKTGYGIENYKKGKSQNIIIEYEWATANRLGLEIEIPINFSKNDLEKSFNNINGIKLATQYFFLVNEKHQTSLAFGYMHEMEFVNQKQFKKDSALFKGIFITPFFIGAKNFNHFSTLIYTGPEFEYDLKKRNTQTNWQLNTSLHYIFANSNNFIGIENNLHLKKNSMEYIIRPEINFGILQNLTIGIFSEIPIKSKEFELDFMTRIIWEPHF